MIKQSIPTLHDRLIRPFCRFLLALEDNITTSEEVAKFGVPIEESYHIEKWSLLRP
jgi:hypothetical protein